jgi:hypothetical protein
MRFRRCGPDRVRKTICHIAGSLETWSAAALCEERFICALALGESPNAVCTPITRRTLAIWQATLNLGSWVHRLPKARMAVAAYMSDVRRVGLRLAQNR